MRNESENYNGGRVFRFVVFFKFILSFFVCFPRAVGVRDESKSEFLRLLHNSKLSGFESQEIYYNCLYCLFFINFLSKLPLIDHQLHSKPKHDFQVGMRPKKPKSIKHNFLIYGRTQISKKM